MRFEVYLPLAWSPRFPDTESLTVTAHVVYDGCQSNVPVTAADLMSGRLFRWIFGNDDVVTMGRPVTDNSRTLAAGISDTTATF